MLNIKNYAYPSAIPKDDPKYMGVLFFIHGHGDYSERTAHVGEMFSKLGYDFYMMDTRGNGKSEGQTVFVPSVN